MTADFCKLRAVSGPLAALASSQPVRPPRHLAALAGGVPLAYYVATACAHVGLNQEGTFVAAARSLGVAHPPGAPLTSLVSSFLALLPVGPLSFRVSVASALFAAVTLGMFARALFFSLLGVGVRSPRLCAPIALASTWFAAQTPLFFSMATRPNVFALQFALALIIIEALVRFELSEPTDDRRTLYFAAFVQGLSFANHHVFALLMLSVAAPTLGRVFARRGFLGLMGHVAAPILGFSAYAYVPIRGGQFPAISMGDPSNLTRSLWVLSAEPWWGPPDVPEPDTLALLRDGLGGGWIALGVFALAVFGFALAGRATSPRRFAALWLIALLVPLASIAWILEPSLTPDAWGALTPCALALVALASLAVGLLLQQLGQRVRDLDARASGVLAALALLALMLGASQHGRARSSASDALDDMERRSLPTRALVLSTDARTWFRFVGSEMEEQLRGDVTMVPLPFLDYPSARARLAYSQPELASVLSDLHPLGRPDERGFSPLPAARLRALAELRPLLLELDASITPALYPSLVSDGTLARVSPATAILERGLTREPERARWATLYRRLGVEVHAPDLAPRLARTHFYAGLVAASLGDHAGASQHVRLGLRSAPRAPRLLQLSAALASNAPLDPAPFLRAELGVGPR